MKFYVPGIISAPSVPASVGFKRGNVDGTCTIDLGVYPTDIHAGGWTVDILTPEGCCLAEYSSGPCINVDFSSNSLQFQLDAAHALPVGTYRVEVSNPRLPEKGFFFWLRIPSLGLMG